ncbi:hypothetical protein Vi05172_g13344 [Venturia inaequalis]|nr:hypothetical protein Vi05172_g13735 [Venturia inaequalis]RDI74899.1 hypothetical protein Vi05172_g13736 [Venturia inaequalis]RDI74900.1 hypothetical protein Vi05172_g13738 [Venturia inaequalis]RDI76669.1 hypothetical protein Vi05172_g13344 [Venturia inaequalis]
MVVSDDGDRNSDYQEHIVDDSDFESVSDNPLDRRGSEASIQEASQAPIQEASQASIQEASQASIPDASSSAVDS